MPTLKPYKKEWDTFYWKSLNDDPSQQPFAFTYNPKVSRKKQLRDDDDEEGEDDNIHAPSPTAIAPISAVQLDTIAEAATDKVFNRVINKMKGVCSNTRIMYIVCSLFLLDGGVRMEHNFFCIVS